MEQNAEYEKKQDEIMLKIEEIYQRKDKDGKPTGRNFISHLLRAYFPVGKSQKVIDVPDKPMKCAITGQKLMAFGEIWHAMNDDKDFFKKVTQHMLHEFNPEAHEKTEHPIAQVAQGRVLAITGEKTDTYLCHEAYQALYNWYATKILHGDKHVNWVLKDERNKSTIKSIREKLPEAEDQKKIDRLEKISKHPQRATMSLGDMVALQELQAKLKSQEEAGSKDGN